MSRSPASRRVRLDSELVRRGLARSREQAVAAIAAGRVLVAGIPAPKAATVVDASTSIAVAEGDDPGYASRGAHKLVGAFAAFGVPAPAGPETSSGSSDSSGSSGSGESAGSAVPSDLGGSGAPAGLRTDPGRRAAPADRLDPPLVVAGRRCLDVGASTGGFTDVLLRYGAASVVAVDVGYGQLIWRLRSDPRVRVLDRTNARYLTPAAVGEPVDLVVGDLSFISLTLVLPAVRECARPDADFVLLVKPQFEVGRERLGPGGVVRDTALHAEAIGDVAAAAARLGLGVRGVTASPLPGPAGNVEYLLWLRADAPAFEPAQALRAIARGPAGAPGEAAPGEGASGEGAPGGEGGPGGEAASDGLPGGDPERPA